MFASSGVCGFRISIFSPFRIFFWFREEGNPRVRVILDANKVFVFEVLVLCVLDVERKSPIQAAVGVVGKWVTRVQMI